MLDKGKTRGLAEINTILGGDSLLERTIGTLQKARRHLDVLEVGMGHGRCLLEFAYQFKDADIAFNGITLKAKVPLEKQEDLRNISTAFAIVPDFEIPTFKLPQVYFYDATKLHFEDESIDLLYSAVTVRFIARKAEFLEEVARVLKPGGHAVIDISESNWNYPYGVVSDDRILTPYTNRFILKNGHELIPLPCYLKLFEAGNFSFQFADEGKCILHVEKFRSSKLLLQLDYNESLSMSAYDLPLKSKSGRLRSGYRSVYDVKPAFYTELFSRGLLTRNAKRGGVIAE